MKALTDETQAVLYTALRNEFDKAGSVYACEKVYTATKEIGLDELAEVMLADLRDVSRDNTFPLS